MTMDTYEAPGNPEVRIPFIDESNKLKGSNGGAISEEIDKVRRGWVRGVKLREAGYGFYQSRKPE